MKYAGFARKSGQRTVITGTRAIQQNSRKDVLTCKKYDEKCCYIMISHACNITQYTTCNVSPYTDSRLSS